jgi:hypothetical protein
MRVLDERHGFRVTGSAQTQDCPTITFMLRKPHSTVRS